MPTVPEVPPQDEELQEVVAALRRLCTGARRKPEVLFGAIIRQALDEVIDGPRTGRWSLEQLSKVEKTYVGTKVEILLRSLLALDDGATADVQVAGHDVDIKWSQSLDWMIAPENVGKLCLGLGLDRDDDLFSVGVFRPTKETLREGANRDAKQSLSAAGRNTVMWLVSEAKLPVNFVEKLADDIRTKVFAEKSAQARVRKLAELCPMVPIPRAAFMTVARDKADPMRRLREDALNSDGLGEMKVLSTKYGRKQLERLGFSDLPKDHWVAVPKNLLEQHD